MANPPNIMVPGCCFVIPMGKLLTTHYKGGRAVIIAEEDLPYTMLFRE